MNTTYTPAQIIAADQLAHANAHLLDVLAHEPVDDSPSWDQWNDAYQDAWHKHESAEQVYRTALGADAPSAFEVLRAAREPVNPLRPTLVPGIWSTRAQRFLVSRYLPGHPKAHLMAVDFWELTINADPESFDPTVRIDVTDLENAQQVVDRITLAMDAEPAEPNS